MAANIVFVRVTLGALADEVVGGLVCEGCRKSGRWAHKIQTIECGQDDQAR